MPTVEFSSTFSCTPAVLWEFHQRPDAIQLLSPPFPPVRIVRDTGGLSVGAEKEFQLGLGPFRLTWLARHVECEPGRSFTDWQVTGPFRSWRHRHLMKATPSGSCLVDHIDYQAYGGPLMDWLVWPSLWLLFRWRHYVTRRYTRGLL